MSQCFHCKKTLGMNEPYFLMRSKDRKFRGRNRYQTVAYCCVDCEAAGKQCRFSIEEWQALRDDQEGWKRLKENDRA